MNLEPEVFDYGNLQEIRNYSRCLLKARWTIKTPLRTKKNGNHRLAHVESKSLRPKHPNAISKLITGQFDSKTLCFRMIAVSTTHPLLNDSPFNFRIYLCKVINSNGISQSVPCNVKVPFFIRVKVLNDKDELFCQIIQPTNRTEHVEISFELPEQTCKDLRLFYSFKTKFIEITFFENDPTFEMAFNDLPQSSHGALNNLDKSIEGNICNKTLDILDQDEIKDNSFQDLDQNDDEDNSDQDYVEDYSDQDNMEVNSDLDNNINDNSNQEAEDNFDLDIIEGNLNQEEAEDSSDLDNIEDNSNQEEVEENFNESEVAANSGQDEEAEASLEEENFNEGEVAGNSGQDEEAEAILEDESCDEKPPKSSRISNSNSKTSKSFKDKKSVSGRSKSLASHRDIVSGSVQKKDVNRATRDEKASGSRHDKSSASRQSEATSSRRDKTPSSRRHKASCSHQDKPSTSRLEKSSSGLSSIGHQDKPSGSRQEKVSSSHLDQASVSHPDDSHSNLKDKPSKSRKDKKSTGINSDSDAESTKSDVTLRYGNEKILNSEPDGPQRKKIKLEKSDSNEDLTEDQDHDTTACPDCHYTTTKLLKNPIFTDVVIKSDLVKIPCHRAILSTVSTVFEKLLRDTDFNAIVDITDHVSATTANHLIAYIYEGVVPQLDFDSYIKLYEAANFYEITPLMVKCLEECQLKLDNENAIAAFEFAISSGCLSLKTKTLDLIVDNKVEVLSTDGWVSIKAEVSKELSASLLTHKC